MPKQRLLLTRTANEEYLKWLSRLENLGIQIGCADDPEPEPNGFSLEQVQYDFATIYEVRPPLDTLSEVAVVVLAELTVLKSGVMITDPYLTTPWDDSPLELTDPEGSPLYEHLIGGLPRYPPTILNHSLTRDKPLRPCAVEGVIIALGWAFVPAECHDETFVTVRLSLRERSNEPYFDFKVRLDRSLRRRNEKLQRERQALRPPKRGGLYDPRETELVDRLAQPKDEGGNRSSGSQASVSKYKV
jgi:hypothetical protein